MPRKEDLAGNIARAKRVAAAMNTDADRDRFEGLAASYQRELDALHAAEGQSAAAEAASTEAGAPTNEPVAATDQASASDAVAPQPPTSADDQEPTTD